MPLAHLGLPAPPLLLSSPRGKGEWVAWKVDLISGLLTSVQLDWTCMYTPAGNGNNYPVSSYRNASLKYINLGFISRFIGNIFVKYYPLYSFVGYLRT